MRVRVGWVSGWVGVRAAHLRSRVRACACAHPHAWTSASTHAWTQACSSVCKYLWVSLCARARARASVWPLLCMRATVRARPSCCVRVRRARGRSWFLRACVRALILRCVYDMNADEKCMTE
eukprot:6172354-Pleurochrysis_carterae.AAC.2